MNTAIVAIIGDATLCALGDHPPKVAKKAAHRRCIFSMGVVQSWYRRDTALQCPRRCGVLPSRSLRFAHVGDGEDGAAVAGGG